mgnify:FL=1
MKRKKDDRKGYWTPYNMGYEDFNDHVSRDDNPYGSHPTDAALEWYKGWDQAKADYDSACNDIYF